MARWRNLFKSKTLQVQPSLGGLRVLDTDATGEHAPIQRYDWESVVWRAEYYWKTVDRKARPVVGKRPVRLRVSGAHENQVAHRAQLRSYRHALETAGLQVTEDYSSGWALALSALVILAGVAVTIGLLAWAGVRLSSGDVAYRLPAETRLLAWVVLGAFLLIHLLIAAPFLVLLTRMILSQRVSRAEFSARGICATMSTGAEVSYPWTELVSLFISGMWAQARFRDARSLWFPSRRPRSRTVAVLRACRDRFLPEEAARQRRAEREVPIRIAIWSLAGAGVSACAATLIRTGDHPGPAGDPILAALGGAAAVLLMGGAAAGCLLWEVRLYRWAFRRRRGRERRRFREAGRVVG